MSRRKVHKWRYLKSRKEVAKKESDYYSGILAWVLVEEESDARNFQNDQSDYS